MRRRHYAMEARQSHDPRHWLVARREPIDQSGPRPALLERASSRQLLVISPRRAAVPSRHGLSSRCYNYQNTPPYTARRPRAPGTGFECRSRQRQQWRTSCRVLWPPYKGSSTNAELLKYPIERDGATKIAGVLSLCRGDVHPEALTDRIFMAGISSGGIRQ